MNSLKSKLTLIFIFAFILVVLPSALRAQETTQSDSIMISTQDVDTAYKILKIVSVKNIAIREVAEKKNLDEIRKLVKKFKGNAAIYVDHWPGTANKDLLNTDAIVVKYLNAKEIENRNKSAKQPPVLKKEHPLDPEPVLIKYSDVDFPYKVLGILNLRSGVGEESYTSQAMDYKLMEAASKEGADAVLFVNYSRVGADVGGAIGIMIKSKPSWESVNKK